MMMNETKENIYQRRPGQTPLSGTAFSDASTGEDVKFSVAISKLSEPVRSGDIYIKGELNAFLSRSSFADEILHYWIRFPASRTRDGCQTETECEDDYLADNPGIGSINLILSKNLRVKSALLAKSAQALTREGLTRITTEDLTGSVIVEDKEKVRSRDVTLLYAGTLFATGIAVGTDGLVELIRFVLQAISRASARQHSRPPIRRIGFSTGPGPLGPCPKTGLPANIVFPLGRRLARHSGRAAARP